MENKKIYVERETYTKNDKSFYSYYIKGNIRGREVKIAITPPETGYGGFLVLDIVFGDAMKAELVVKPFEIKDSNGKAITGNTFAIRSFDEKGDLYECNVKPFRQSDKTLLNMLLKQAA